MVKKWFILDISNIDILKFPPIMVETLSILDVWNINISIFPLTMVENVINFSHDIFWYFQLFSNRGGERDSLFQIIFQTIVKKQQIFNAGRFLVLQNFIRPIYVVWFVIRMICVVMTSFGESQGRYLGVQRNFLSKIYVVVYIIIIL